jgi:lambda family phage portal protein
MNRFERAIQAVSPTWAARRARSRSLVAYYESANTDRLRKGRQESGSGNTAVAKAGPVLRNQARHLDQNHDLARGVLDVLVRNTVGANGIGIEPQIRTKAGDVHLEASWQIQKLLRAADRRPEVTWQHNRASMERLLARSWFRDGEVFGQRLLGSVTFLEHGSALPYSVEMLEADHVPLFYNRAQAVDQSPITMGVETNAWNRPVAYWVFKKHPSDMVQMVQASDVKRIPAEQMLHLKLVDRIGQLRGVSVFAAVLTRLDDLKDYEESERIAAKVAAAMAAMIIKGEPADYAPPAEGATPRQMRFAPGMVFDDLRPGESVETIDSKRPNPNAVTWRQGQLRAVASGTMVSYSSMAKDYNGTYSAQRQELVEQYGAYGILASEFISRITQPIYEDRIRAALAARLLKLPAEIDLDTLYDAVYIPPQMPWIDPKKEAEAWALLEDRRYASGPEIIRMRGRDPYDVLDQQKRWQSDLKEAGLEAAPPPPAPGEQQPPDDEDSADDEEANA